MTPMSQDGGRQYLPPRAVAMIESTVCAGLDAFGADPIPVIGRPADADGPPLAAIRLDRGSLVSARNDWLEALRPVVTNMHPDLLFSTFGAYELARVTQPDGESAWGPVFFFFGDASTWNDPGGPARGEAESGRSGRRGLQAFLALLRRRGARRLRADPGR